MFSLHKREENNKKNQCFQTRTVIETVNNTVDGNKFASRNVISVLTVLACQANHRALAHDDWGIN